MAPPLVRCLACDRGWHSATLAAGLRSVGCCPRCGGELAFTPGAATTDDAPKAAPALPPHLVLGVPRR
jgi:rRNA maturation endonuclease Nob1